MPLPPDLTLKWDAVASQYVLGQPAAPVIPPVIPPIITPPATTGVQAFRSAEALRLLGMNTFMGIDADTNVFGAWPGDNSQASLGASVKYFAGGLGRVRDYYRAQFRSWQEPWGQAVRAASGVRFSLTPASGASLADAVSLGEMAVVSSLTSGWIEQIEGALEPNNFKIPSDQAVAMQEALWAAGQRTKGNKWPVKVAGPSVVVGMPHPEGWIMPIQTTGVPGNYFSTAQLARVRAAMEVINLHFYPPGNADLASGGRGGWLQDTIAGDRVAYGDLPISITEGQTTLYTATGHKLDPAYDAYYGALLLFSAYRARVDVIHWFSMVDVGQVDIKDDKGVVIGHEPEYSTGLFPRTGGANPRPVAATWQAIAMIMGDTSPDALTFAPDRLGVTVTGLPAPAAGAPYSGGHWMLFQSRSKGQLCLVLLNSQRDPGGSARPATITFDRTVKDVTEYNVTDPIPGGPLRPVQKAVGPLTIVTSMLDASVRLLVITP